MGRARDVLTTPIDDTVVGIGLLAIAAIVLIWGIALIADSYRWRGRPDLPRWRPRRWVAPSFGFWLGWFLVVSDAGIYAILGTGVLRSPAGTALWAVGYVVFCAALAVVAFGSWARERLPGRGAAR